MYDAECCQENSQAAGTIYEKARNRENSSCWELWAFQHDGLEDVREVGCEVGGQEAGGTADTSAPVQDELGFKPWLLPLGVA